MSDKFDASDHIRRGARLGNLREVATVVRHDADTLRAERKRIRERDALITAELQRLDGVKCGTGIDVAAKRLLAEVDDVRSGRKVAPIIPTAWPSLTNKIKGYPCGHITIWAARPAKGKSVAMEWEAVEQAKQGRGVIFVTLEMTIPDLLLRMALREADIATVGLDIYDVEKAPESDRDALADAFTRLDSLPIRFIGNDGEDHDIDDDKPLTWTDIESQLNAMIANWPYEDPPRMVILDWLTEVGTSDIKARGIKFPHQVVAARIRNWIKRRRNMAFLLVHALSRPQRPQNAKDDWVPPRPTMESLREVGMLDYYAYCIILIERSEQGSDHSIELGYELCSFIVAKIRGAAPGPVEMMWDSDVVCFVEGGSGLTDRQVNRW